MVAGFRNYFVCIDNSVAGFFASVTVRCFVFMFGVFSCCLLVLWLFACLEYVVGGGLCCYFVLFAWLLICWVFWIGTLVDCWLFLGIWLVDCVVWLLYFVSFVIVCCFVCCFIVYSCFNSVVLWFIRYNSRLCFMVVLGYWIFVCYLCDFLAVGGFIIGFILFCFDGWNFCDWLDMLDCLWLVGLWWCWLFNIDIVVVCFDLRCVLCLITLLDLVNSLRCDIMVILLVCLYFCCFAYYLIWRVCLFEFWWFGLLLVLKFVGCGELVRLKYTTIYFRVAAWVLIWLVVTFAWVFVLVMLFMCLLGWFMLWLCLRWFVSRCFAWVYLCWCSANSVACFAGCINVCGFVLCLLDSVPVVYVGWWFSVGLSVCFVGCCCCFTVYLFRFACLRCFVVWFGCFVVGIVFVLIL